jgi:hypothetical protein
LPLSWTYCFCLRSKYDAVCCHHGPQGLSTTTYQSIQWQSLCGRCFMPHWNCLYRPY